MFSEKAEAQTVLRKVSATQTKAVQYIISHIPSKDAKPSELKKILRTEKPFSKK